MTVALYSNMPQSDPLHFESGSDLDFKKVADFLDLDANALSKISGLSKKSIRFDGKIPTVLRERMKEIAIVCSLVAEHFDGDALKTHQWFTIPNPMLGGVRPRDMIRLGRYNRLLKFVIEARESNDGTTAAT